MFGYIKNIFFDICLVFFDLYFYNDFNIFLLLISLDNISYAIDFISNNFNKTLNYKEIINENNKLYISSLFERYIFYSFITCLYYFINIFILGNYLEYIKILLSLLSYPYINNIIYNNYTFVFKQIIIIKDDIIELIICEQIYNIIKKLNKYYIDDKILLDKKEIIDILKKSSNIKSEITTFIKNFLVVILLNYFKSKSFLYYKITKYIYIYNSGNYFINNINSDDAKDKFINIFKNKNYLKLNEPMTIHSMLYLYYNKKTDTNLDIIYININYNIISFITLWTCTSFFDDIFRLYILFLISFFIKLSKKNIKKIYDKKYIINILFGLFGYYLFNNAIWISFIHQFGYELIDNFITKNMYNIFYKNFYIHIKNNYRKIFCIIHNDLSSYIKNIIYTLLMKLLFTIDNNYGYIFLLYITNYQKCIYTKYLYICIFISMLNNKNMITLFILSYIGTLIFNIIQNINNINNISYVNQPNKDNMIEEEIKNAIETIIDNNNIDNKIKNNTDISEDLVIIENYYK